MIRHFICLANSKKFGERCIAGIEISLNKEKKSYQIISKNGEPQWIRPVSNSAHGEVAEELVASISLNDVVELDIVAETPKGYQCENMLFDPKSIRKVSRINLLEKALDNLVNNNQPNLFGNRGKAVPEDSIGGVTCSITFIKVDNPQTFVRTDYDKPQLRMKFVFKGANYDLPVTDLDFIRKYKINENILTPSSKVYLTISLGVEYNEWYYKLVAGVVLL